MANYNSYIELSPHYESVVDIDSENRNPNMWQEYIVHEDMKDALDKICQSLSFEDMCATRLRILISLIKAGSLMISGLNLFHP